MLEFGLNNGRIAMSSFTFIPMLLFGFDVNGRLGSNLLSICHSLKLNRIRNPTRSGKSYPQPDEMHSNYLFRHLVVDHDRNLILMHSTYLAEKQNAVLPARPDAERKWRLLYAIGDFESDRGSIGLGGTPHLTAV